MASTPTAAEKRPARGRRATKSTGDERERAILETMELLLESQSFHSISIDDLARGAGISRPSFYFYFPSKEAVLLTLLDAIIAEADADSDAAQLLLENDPARYLSEAISAYLNTFGAHRAVAMAGNEAAATNPLVKGLWSQVSEGWVQSATAAIEAERARGAAPDGLPARDLAITLVKMNEGVLFASFAGVEPAIPEDRVVETLLAVWLNAVYQGQLS